MKKAIITLLILCFIPVLNIFADEYTSVNQSTEESLFLKLSKENRREYLFNKIYIDGEQRTRGSGYSSTSTTYDLSSGSMLFGSGSTYSNFNSSTSLTWYPYIGGNKLIDRVTFFELVGEKELAKEYQEYLDKMKKRKNIMLGVGWSMFGVGAVMGVVGIVVGCLGSANKPQGSYGSTTQENVGFGIACAGIGLMGLSSIPLFIYKFGTKPHEPDVTIAFAIDLANEYNSSLLKRLM